MPQGNEDRLRMLAKLGAGGWLAAACDRNRAERTSRPFSPIRSSLLAVALLAFPSWALAISVYDVVKLSQKGYTDEQIIALIEASDSVFELRADDLPKLKRAGVSERVIRKMLERPAPEARAGDAETPTQASDAPARGSEESEPGHRHDRETSNKGTPPPGRLPQDRKLLTPGAPGLLSSHPVSEEGAGRHTHMAVALGGVRLLILRDEAGLASIQARAEEVARRLDEARALGSGEFRPEHVGGTDAVVFRGVAGRQAIVITSVTARDAVAYQRRSGRRVNPDDLAQYWADLLNDYWAIYFLGKPPARLVQLHEGEALQSLYQAARRTAEGAEGVESAVRQLPRAALQHLERLATMVPVDFRASGSHEQESKP